MKTRTTVISLCVLVAIACAGCKQIPPFQQHTSTLQGTIFNAITGERIGGKDLKMYLQQGTTLRQPDVFYTGVKGMGTIGDNTTIYLKGDYAFANIPSMDNFTSPCSFEYRLTVIKEGYQRFEGIIDNDMLANKDNVIRNIYLFPEDYLIPCYDFTAVFNGQPVPGVTVAAIPYATLNPGIIATDKWLSIDLGSVADGVFPLIGTVFNVFTLFNNNYFFPAPGYLASILEETDSDGKASLCDNIAAGGAYLVCTTPVEFENVNLVSECKILIAGYSDTDQIFELEPADNTGNAYGLYVTSASNSAIGKVDATGTLTIQFNRPVTLAGNFAATLSGTGTLDALDPVNESLSADGLTLTLTPNWTAEPALDAANVFITYGDGTALISVQNYPGSEIGLFACGSPRIMNAEDSCASGQVQIRN